jgi:carbonic anhydrase
MSWQLTLPTTQNFESSHLTGRAAQGLAIITCMDSRISPLAIVGMGPGDVKILRNAGARVTDDVLRTLVLGNLPARS